MKWEYKTVYVPLDGVSLQNSFADHERFDDALTNDGANGWELVAVLPHRYAGSLSSAAEFVHPTELLLFFKRPLA